MRNFGTNVIKENNIFFSKIIILTSFLYLLIGNVLYEPRLPLIPGFISINQIIIYFSFLLILISNGIKKELCFSVVFFSPLYISAIQLLNSADFDYGFYKYFNLLFCVIVVSAMFTYSIRTFGFNDFSKSVIAFLLILLAFSILYKLKNGFFNRQVNFLFNGPIVFARLMGIGLIICILNKSFKFRTLISFIFLTAMVWTQSKGPLLALFFSLTLYFFIENNNKQKFKVLLLSIPLVLVFAYNISDIISFQYFERYLSLVSALQGDLGGSNYGSLGVRVDAYIETINAIINFPMGIGLGSWPYYFTNFNFDYPHNLILEVLVELGVFIGCVFLIPVFSYFRITINYFFYIWIFLFINQMYSGDILDSRYLLVLSFLMFRFRNDCNFKK